MFSKNYISFSVSRIQEQRDREVFFQLTGLCCPLGKLELNPTNVAILGLLLHLLLESETPSK